MDSVLSRVHWDCLEQPFQQIGPKWFLVITCIICHHLEFWRRGFAWFFGPHLFGFGSQGRTLGPGDKIGQKTLFWVISSTKTRASTQARASCRATYFLQRARKPRFHFFCAAPITFILLSRQSLVVRLTRSDSRPQRSLRSLAVGDEPVMLWP